MLQKLIQAAHLALVEVQAQTGTQNAVVIHGFACGDGAILQQITEVQVELGQLLRRNGGIEQ